MPNRNFVKEDGLVAVQNGYPVCFTRHETKAPYRKDWWNKPASEEACRNGGDRPDDGVGIICGRDECPIYGIDADIDGDVEFAQAFRKVVTDKFSDAPIRVGKAPKFLAMVRGEAPGVAVKPSAVFVKDDRKVQLEILGKGRQFVAFGIHPGTGKPYEWQEGYFDALSPLSMKPIELPIASHADFDELKEAFAKMAKERGYSQESENADQMDDLANALTPLKGPIPNLTIDDVRKILVELKLDLGAGTREVWRDLAFALSHQFHHSNEAKSLFEELSWGFPEAYDQEVLDKLWDSIHDDRPNGITLRTFLYKWRKKSAKARELTQTGLLNRFIAHYGSLVAYLPATRVLVGFDTSRMRWDFDKGEAIAAGFVRDLIENRLLQEAEEEEKLGEAGNKQSERVQKFAMGLRKKAAGTESTLIGMVKRTQDLVFDENDFDANSRWFGVANGVLDLETYTLRENAPELMVSRYSKANFDPNADCPTWRKAVYEWFDCDQEMVDFVQCLIGSAMTGNPLEDKMGILRGTGCNGKSSFIDVLSNVFGDYAIRVKEETLLGKGGIGQGGQARSDLVRMNHARLVMCSETSENGRLRESDIKMLTGREAFPARSPYGVKDIMIQPTWVLLMATNYLPNIKGDDNGIWRRILDIEFPIDFDHSEKFKKDLYLGEKLRQEYPGILNWCLEGLKRYRAQGKLAVPKKVDEAVAEYREAMDVIGHWFSSRVTEDPNGRLDYNAAFQNFIQFCQSQGEGTGGINQAGFSRKLKQKYGFETKKSNSKRYAPGYRLLTAADDFESLPDSDKE